MGEDISHRDEALHLTCVERGWRSHRLNGDLYLFEDKTDKLVRIDDAVVTPLARTPQETSLADGLAQAMDVATADDSSYEPRTGDLSEWTVSLRLLGVRVDVRCVHKTCADDVKTYFSPVHDPHPAGSPEAVVRCSWPTADRHLFRAREDTAEGTKLDGVTVQILGTTQVPWTSSHQPLPPLTVWPFANRFIALHAAVVRASDGQGLLIAGDRGAGKTTAALALANDHGAELLADETAFVICRTTVAAPFPHAVGVWHDGQKVQVPVTEVCESIGDTPINVSRLVFLVRRPGGVEDRPITPAEALRRLLPHHRHGGASTGDAMATILNMASTVRASVVSYEDYQDLGPTIAGLVQSSG